ncbi:MAG: hypothetical protein ATN35_00965 [Epulopiscium sp. Nele67-Bin004]|nr:MAG: hypothetical protein ATN35_00965 [Epulopiscium sp. Nele67-Bin004]
MKLTDIFDDIDVDDIGDLLDIDTDDPDLLDGIDTNKIKQVALNKAQSNVVQLPKQRGRGKMKIRNLLLVAALALTSTAVLANNLPHFMSTFEGDTGYVYEDIQTIDFVSEKEGDIVLVGAETIVTDQTGMFLLVFEKEDGTPFFEMDYDADRLVHNGKYISSINFDIFDIESDSINMYGYSAELSEDFSQLMLVCNFYSTEVIDEEVNITIENLVATYLLEEQSPYMLSELEPPTIISDMYELEAVTEDFEYLATNRYLRETIVEQSWTGTLHLSTDMEIVEAFPNLKLDTSTVDRVSVSKMGINVSLTLDDIAVGNQWHDVSLKLVDGTILEGTYSAVSHRELLGSYKYVVEDSELQMNFGTTDVQFIPMEELYSVIIEGHEIVLK